MLTYFNYPPSPQYTIAVETDGELILSIRVIQMPQSEPKLDNQLEIIGPLKYVQNFIQTYFDENADPQSVKEVTSKLLPYLAKACSSFAASVREALLERLPFGSTATYAELARFIGNPKAVRAVGQALHNNPFHIVVPCHRVVSKDPDKVYYAAGTDVKRCLLRHEAACIHAPVTAMIPF